MPDLARIHDDLDLIVENRDMIVEINREDGMTDLEVEILHRDDAHLLRRKAQIFESQVLGDGDIIEIAELGEEFDG